MWNVASCWLHSANILAMHGPTNVKLNRSSFLNSVIRNMGFCAGIVNIHQFMKLTCIYNDTCYAYICTCVLDNSG